MIGLKFDSLSGGPIQSYFDVAFGLNPDLYTKNKQTKKKQLSRLEQGIMIANFQKQKKETNTNLISQTNLGKTRQHQTSKSSYNLLV